MPKVRNYALDPDYSPLPETNKKMQNIAYNTDMPSKGTKKPSKSRLRQNRAGRKDIQKSSMHGNSKF